MTFPNDNNKNLNPWVLQKNTYNRNGTLIYDITYNLNRVLIPSEIILDLDKNNWIMKMSSNGICEDEIDIITQLKFEECHFSIKFPKFNYYKYGRTGKYSWLVMEKYDGVIRNDFDYCKSQIKNLSFQIISFLEWLHVSKDKVHGDIKSDNIVFKKEDDSFRLIDFESVSDRSGDLCFESLPNGYYYYGLGCEYDKPSFSFRMDLQAFGYILWDLLLIDTNFKDFDWQKNTFSYYKKKTKQNLFHLLEKEKTQNMLEVEKPEIIKKYFSIIENYSWFEEKAIPEIYTNLKELFLHSE